MNIPRSSSMEGEHTPTIIQLIQSMDLTVIQLKDSHLFFIFPTLNTSHILAGAITNGSGYPSMSIPIRKHNNPNRYGRILIPDHESWRKIRYSTTDYLQTRNGEGQKEKKKIKNSFSFSLFPCTRSYFSHFQGATVNFVVMQISL